ncbi:MAG TPA: ABC transporter ATP-binding protein [Candidatus Sulfotelmatobacter sp.]|nr:ABC transporter ATP-binding protein [Candidatus Sulfotelmatobacter sp.]
MLRLEAIHAYYGDSYILQGVSLHVPRGSVTALLGRNGMGKTTLIRTAIGFLRPSRGKVFFRDRDVTAAASYDRARMGMGLVPQGRRVFRSLTVKENLLAARYQDSGRQVLERVFALFPRLAERADQRSDKLSGGEQQMLAIGRAMMGEPQLLLMDEPTEGLAPLLVRATEDTILQLRDAGFSILLVEQNMPLALSVATYVHVINRGQIVHSSTPRELQENHEITNRYLGVGQA